MEIINKIAKIREKLDLYGKPYITEELLQKLLDKFAPNYSITNLSNLGLITPIKRGKVYINNKYNAFVNSFVVGDLYMGDDLYIFGGLGVYNRYSLTEQVAEWQTIYNTKISGKKIIGNSKFIFVRQRENFFYGGKKEKFEEYSYNIMTIERAFIQMIKEGKDFSNLPYGINKDKLLKFALKYAPKTIISKIEKLCI
ncbi:MAG: hypothetical protein PHR68_04455 [Candidatus Gracilibacteria bacterium]|nr:hypothetical protein [Candidatus Gracilibacteria bacterium]